MNPYWQQQHGLTHDEKLAFVDRVKAENAAFLGNLRTIHSQAENRMLTLVARDRSGVGDDDDADDASVKPAS